MIPVTKSFLPPRSTYDALVDEAWSRAHLTNHGPLARRLEEAVAKALDAPRPILTCNGTVPLHMALQALGAGGEIITTPFSFVATCSSIVWEHCTPVFVDIDPEHLTLDETQIEAAVTPRTTAILATHVFGNPCAVHEIDAIAKRHGLHVLYDAAHAFGVRFEGRSLFAYGDVSTCSFHATKVFHTAEGGALFVPDPELDARLRPMGNFGQAVPGTFAGVGTNAKMSELHAAMGLSILPHFAHIVNERRKVVEAYQHHLEGSGLRFQTLREGTEWNHAYFPVLFPDEASLLACMERLEAQQVFARRYFHPSLHHLPYLDPSPPMPVSEHVAATVLCLPLYVGLAPEDVERIAGIVRAALHDARAPPTAQGTASVTPTGPSARPRQTLARVVRAFARRARYALRFPLDALRYRRHPKVFCVGANKTGTTSIEALLRRSGYRLGAQWASELLLYAWGRGDFRKIVRHTRYRGDAFQDVPFSYPGTFKALDEAIPGSKFILTVRKDADQWYESLVRFESKVFGGGKLPTRADFERSTYVRPGWAWDAKRLRGVVTEDDLYDREAMTRSYEEHNQAVMEHFADRPDQLLVVNVADPDALERITAFLGIESDLQEMPWENKT